MRLSLRDSSMVEQLTVNQLVPGSSPGRGALSLLFLFFRLKTKEMMVFVYEEENRICDWRILSYL